VKQRDKIAMTDQEIQTFLTQQRSATVGTIGADGNMHLVGMWYAVLDGQVWFETKAKSQKVVNLRRNDRISFLVEAGHTYDKLRGVALEGRGVIVEDPDDLWRVGVNVFERYNAPYTEELRPFVEAMVVKRVAIRVDVERARTWDHRKLGMSEIGLGGSTAEFIGQD
jgi:PPOX class probable F420-dependent enzyme